MTDERERDADDQIQRLTATQRESLFRALRDRRPRPDLRGPSPGSGSDAPLSRSQQAVWLFEQLFPNSAAYEINAVRRVRGRCDPAILEASINRAVERHEALRTVIASTGGKPFQRILPVVHVPLVLEDLSSLGFDERAVTLHATIDRHTTRPFDLSVAPLLRAVLIQLMHDDHLVLLRMHHMISDGRSLRILFDEIRDDYAALAAGTPSAYDGVPASSYAAFCAWQSRWLASPEKKRQLDYWRVQLDGAQPLELPGQYPRPPVQTFLGARTGTVLDDERAAALRALARREGVTLFVVLLTGFYVVLARHSGQEDIAIGAPVEGRTRAEFANTVGFFVNSVVLRTDLSGDPTLRELIGRVQATLRGALIHQELPYEELVRELRPHRDGSRNPLFQVYVNMAPGETEFASGAREARDIGFDAYDSMDEAAKVDLTLYVSLDDAAIGLSLVYNTDLYERPFVEQLLEHLTCALTNAGRCIEEPLSRLPIVPGPVSRAATAPTAAPGVRADQTLIARFASHVRRTPDAPAIVHETGTWSYAELGARAARLSRFLRAKTGDPASHICVLCDHRPETVAMIVGVLGAGASFVPLESGHPLQRLRTIVDDIRPAAILTRGAHAETLASGFAGTPIYSFELTQADAHDGSACEDVVAPGAVAYVLYTSGSVGRPKGVIQSHRNASFNMNAYARSIEIAPHDRLSVVASLGTDAALMDIFGAFSAGASLSLFDPEMTRVDALATWLSERSITVFHATPTVFRYALAAQNGAADLRKVRAVVLGGEEAYGSDLELFKARFATGTVLVNGFGPTESTIALQSFHDHGSPAERERLPIGSPVSGIDVLLVNREGAPVETLAVGEIVIRSPHVALGYFDEPELTNARFRAGAGGVREYSTGDLARLRLDGAVEYVGRADSQVKIRGQQVNLDETEATIRRHPHIGDCKVLLEQHGMERELAAYIIPAGRRFAARSLRRDLAENLPRHMIPRRIVTVDAFPLTASGKLDRAALARLEHREPATSRPRYVTRGNAERAVAEAWEEVLGTAVTAADENFFDLGGHSLHMLAVHRAIADRLGLDFPLLHLFRYPTIAALARALDDALVPPFATANFSKGTGLQQ